MRERHAMDFTVDTPPNVITRGIGDIENDFGMVVGEIEDLEGQLASLYEEKEELEEEMLNFEEDDS